MVRFGATAGTVQQLTTTAITARTPAGSAGLVAISVTNPDGGAATRVSAFTYLGAPTISSVSPATGPTTGGTDVVITGTGFQTGAVVRFGATAGVVQQLTSISLTVRAPSGATGIVAVSVTNPDGGAATRASAFTYQPPPAIFGLSPSSGTIAGGTDVTVSGSGFQPGAVVRFGGTAATLLQQTATALTVRTPAGATGTVAVSVTNPDGGTVTRGNAFTYEASILPTVTSFAPASGSIVGGTEVTITGTNFQAGVVVRFGTVPAPVSSVTATRLVVRTPAQAPGVVPLTVLNPDGNGVQVAQAFTYRGPAPSVSKVSPTTGPASGGIEVTVDGANFQAGASVSVDGLPATVLSVTAARIVMRMPAHAPTVVGLTVINPDSQMVWVPSAFTYVNAAPTITRLAPTRGAIEGGTAVVITGTGFAVGATVLVDGQAAAITARTSESISVVTPAHASGTVSVLVRNADGQSVTAVNSFTYDEAAPLITNVAPAIGPIEGGTTLTITGVRFGAGPAVTVGGLVARVLSNTPTTVTAETPAHAAGAVDVVLTFGNGQTTTSLASFTYEDRRAPETFVRYFAEGAAGSFFETRFALANPHAEAVPVTVTFTDTRGTATTIEVVVPATSRTTIDETNRPELASEAFATRFEAPRVIAVERTMTWAAGGPAYGAHSDVGVTAPRTSWVVAEGATIGGFNTFYLLQNPTTRAAEVKVQYLLATGQRIEKIHPVAPLSRTNIWVNKDDPALAAAEMSATITSLNDVPVVVERSMYRNNGSELFTAGHNSAAVDAPALRWFLAEGATGGSFDEFVLIANPNVIAATLRVSYLRAGRAPIVKTYLAAAQSRLTIWVDQEAPELAAAEVSVIVESLTATPVVVERSMWWRATPTGEWTEAHNSRGVTTTAARWLVADGESGGPRDASTYVLVANTAGVDAPVRFTLLTETGATRTVQDLVTANGRYSMDVASAFPEARGTRFSVLVESVAGTASLVVERASYTSTPTTVWAAGTNSLAVPLP